MKRTAFYWFVCCVIFANLSCRFWRGEEKIADVDDIAINRADVEKTAAKDMFDLRRQIYSLERQKLDEYISATLLTREAKKRNIPVPVLLEQEVTRKVPQVTEEDIHRFYNSNKNRIAVELDKVHDQIRDYLREQKIAKQKAEFLKSLRSNAKITTYLKPPPVYRIDVPSTGAPSRGAEHAPVTIVKFEDFQCPFCKTAQPTFKDLLKKYDGKVRVIHKDLPLDAIHPLARQAAEAARCAGEQGKFWEYHDQLYSVSPKLSAEDLKSSAKQVGLNAVGFNQCLASGKYRSSVQKDLNDGAQLGLTGTPTFFINGREMSGALPIDTLSATIDEELALVR